MKAIEDDLKKQVLKKFRKEKAMGVIDLTVLLDCSAITVRRYLKQWCAITSYNFNGRYYALPDVAKFNKHGLWDYKGIRFSRHGNLTKSIIRVVENSPSGMDALTLSKLLTVDCYPILARLNSSSLLQREKISGVYIYFSKERGRFNEQYSQCKEGEMIKKSDLPSDAVGIAILVNWIKKPNISSAMLADRLQKQGIKVSCDIIHNFMRHHGILKKTQHSM